MKNKTLSLLFCLLLITTVFSQVKEVNPPDFIKTITFSGGTQQAQLPVIRLGSALTLEFDALNGDEEDFYYVIEHYNFDWTKSVLMKGEYLRGTDNQRIFNYENSFNTFQLYSHYRLRIPNEQTRGLLKSGNYLVSIYDDYDELVFSRKFMIYEDIVNVGVAVKRYRDVKYINEMQSIDLRIATNSINFFNPMDNIKTMIIQNNNLNTAITDLKPQYVLGNELIYRYVKESGFFGGNEFWFFENKDIRAANVGVQFIDLKDIYHNYLFTSFVRKDRPYTYNPDINGNFLVNVIDRQNTDIEADYAVIHFSLDFPNLEPGKKIHVYGNFNNYAIEDMTELFYNQESGLYECNFRLKQGFYNYKYVVVNEDGSIDEGAISGNFWQTENNYKALVYYRDVGARFDRLIGFGEGSSVNISN
ncbi:DUF5103 domain-containing protein [Ichthyenterobacterium sp. W332]|uniref:DUF5103 domain-containing protein n=1 Tax=Microcosmobacter mediterraneus TaxID=3075607 RepID=A0ABU2YMS3_9FLAO|nr:DUF5103 domain-containing protein [Ichthyenterobacterium sp. W332]MDT0559347.1 DUF5103 domain-containing protein [Ichthyenterobacterium sp. W332]